MRQGQGSKRSRGRGGGRRNAPQRHQSFDSNGPSIRIRGNAHQVYEKYLQLARDANAAGDRVMAENMFQHAEHYYRLLNTEEKESQARAQNRGNGEDGDGAHSRQANKGNGADHRQRHPRKEEQPRLDTSNTTNADAVGHSTPQGEERTATGTEPLEEEAPRRPQRRARRSNGREATVSRDEPVATEDEPVATEDEPVATEIVAEVKSADVQTEEIETPFDKGQAD